MSGQYRGSIIPTTPVRRLPTEPGTVFVMFFQTPIYG